MGLQLPASLGLVLVLGMVLGMVLVLVLVLLVVLLAVMLAWERAGDHCPDLHEMCAVEYTGGGNGEVVQQYQ